MIQHSTSPKVCSMQWWQWWQKIARRVRVPLGFFTAVVYLVEVARRAPHPRAIAWSLALVLPGLSLRAAASGTVKKNRELTVTGPYAFTRNPLYLGSTLIAAGFAVALLSWPVALLLAFGFAVIYVPVIASEERFLRSTFPRSMLIAAACLASSPDSPRPGSLPATSNRAVPRQLPKSLVAAFLSLSISNTASTMQH